MTWMRFYSAGRNSDYLAAVLPLRVFDSEPAI
jgi:hypothetical protein